MLENYSKKQIQNLLKELNKLGYEVKTAGKQQTLEEIVAEMTGSNEGKYSFPYSVRNLIYEITDMFTDNYIDKITRNGKTNKMRNTGLPFGKEREYRQIMRLFVYAAIEAEKIMKGEENGTEHTV